MMAVMKAASKVVSKAEEKAVMMAVARADWLVGVMAASLVFLKVEEWVVS